MDHNSQGAGSIYTPALIEFAARGVELATLLEQGAERREYVRRMLELLPRLYSLVLALPDYMYSPEIDLVEEYITEASYERVRARAEEIIGEEDTFLTTFSGEMQYSDTPLANHISELLADIYQHVGNLLGILREQNELALPAAIGRCRLYWNEHWGLALISALGALHQIYVGMEAEDPLDDEDAEGDDLDLDDFID